MQINEINNKFSWVYKAGFFIVLALPLFTFLPWMYPADFPKTIIFRSILAILSFVGLWQHLKNNPTSSLTLSGLRGARIIWALLGLLSIYFLASIFSVDPYFSFWGSPWRGGGFISFAFYFIFAILAFILFKKDDWQKAWDFSIIIGILVSFIAIIQYYGLFNKIFLSVDARPSSTMGNPIILGIYLLLLFFLTVTFFIKQPFNSIQDKIKKAFYVSAILIFLYTILISGSRAPYLGLLTGSIFFILFYPAKSLKLSIFKILTIACVIIGSFTIYYINSEQKLPQAIESNKIFQTVKPRLSFNLIFADSRFYAWTRVDDKILLEKPILGYGPENFSVGFDKYYDPSIPYLSKDWGSWWDRAHNILIQTGSDAGFLGIMAYLLLFAALFYQLQRFKNQHKSAEISINPCLLIHGMQATLIGYFTANFFSFDSFSTYLIFFLLIAYALQLTSIRNNPPSSVKIEKSINPRIRLIITSVLLCALIFFIYQYNLKPFLINKDLNKSRNFVNQKDCFKGLTLMEKTLKQNSFLDSYARMEGAELAKKCGEFYPENNLIYIKRAQELITEAVKIQPLYTRYWLFLADVTTIMASQEKDPNIKNKLFGQTKFYLETAFKLAPKHQEIMLGYAKMNIAMTDYKNAQDYSKNCIALDSSLGECYFYLALTQIYLKDSASAEKNIETASSKLYNINSKTSLGQLSDAYGSVPDYEKLVIVYNKLITLINPNFAQYHSSLAFFYKHLGRFKEARQEALITLQLSPESKQAVDEFLKTLPY